MNTKELSRTERSIYKFGQNKTSESIPCGNATINATVQFGSNSIIIIARIVKGCQYFGCGQEVEVIAFRGASLKYIPLPNDILKISIF